MGWEMEILPRSGRPIAAKDCVGESVGMLLLGFGH